MKRRTVSILTLILLIIMIALLSVFMGSQADLNRAEEELVALVEYDYQVKAINDFYWTTTDRSYFSLDFQDEKDQQIYAIVAREGGDIEYYQGDEIITEMDAKSITASAIENPNIIQTRLGKYQQKPIWEMTIKNSNQTITYYVIDAITGEWVQTISNI
ncbi:hypothetical protein HZY91_01010 [Facklamia sp. DSM 111018]|uniref:DUF5590 domain-containing protein n=1 Tax=Facklamia lactis TaxID=2749967 RepID=A0ABS0LPN9_9LACT|nr:hypothetical protein [Facklamia lactis]MBG9979850.1 hypothetical protein [Facklamia lactis]MBG9985470.1 hypothetical protein [Facklamia lactis]